MNCVKPLVERDARIFKNRPDRDGELSITIAALVQPFANIRRFVCDDAVGLGALKINFPVWDKDGILSHDKSRAETRKLIFNALLA